MKTDLALRQSGAYLVMIKEGRIPDDCFQNEPC